MEKEMKCPKCNSTCERDNADVGIDWVDGPFGCPNCDWSESAVYDLSENQSPIDVESGCVKDKFGGLHPMNYTMTE